MSALSQLNFVAVKKSARLSPQQHRRAKLAGKLAEQIKLAEARANGTHYQPSQLKSVVNAETGLRSTVETTKRIKEWWWTGDNGKLLLSIRYGAKVIELAKGKNAVELADMAALLDALTAIHQAVLAGELDAQIEAASGQLRAGFKK